jgi:peptidyl-dipeptidase Dcp
MFLIMGLSGLIFSSCKNQSDADKTNPFFSEYNTPFYVPPFEKIMAKHYMPAFEKGMTEGRKDIQNLVKNQAEPDFDNTIGVLDKSGELLTRVSQVFFAQASANTNDSLQNIEMEISPKLTGYNDEIRLNPDLFKRVKHVYDNQEKFNLNPEQKFILENLYKEFVRNGANLNKADQDTLKKINQRLSVLCVKFNQNVLEENNSYKLFVGKDGLAGLPESLVSAAAETSKAAGRSQVSSRSFSTLQTGTYGGSCSERIQTEETTGMNLTTTRCLLKLLHLGPSVQSFSGTKLTQILCLNPGWLKILKMCSIS